MSKNILQNIIQKKIEKVDKLKKSLDLKTLDELIYKNISYINFKVKIGSRLNLIRFCVPKMRFRLKV